MEGAHVSLELHGFPRLHWPRISRMLDKSPLAPGASNDEVPRLSGISANRDRTSADTSIELHAASTVPASYELFFLSRGQIVPTPPVCGSSSCQELTLRAHVESSSGPAQRGAVTFQYCSFKGGPPYDITRADEAPSSACEVDGTSSKLRGLSASVSVIPARGRHRQRREPCGGFHMDRAVSQAVRAGVVSYRSRRGRSSPILGNGRQSGNDVARGGHESLGSAWR